MKKYILILIVSLIPFAGFSQIDKFILYPQFGMGLNFMDLKHLDESTTNGSFYLGASADFGESGLIQPGFYVHDHISNHVANGVDGKLRFKNREFHLLIGKSFLKNETIDFRAYIGPGLVLPYEVDGNNFAIDLDDFKALNTNIKLKMQFNFLIFHAGAEYVWGLSDVLMNYPSKWDQFNVYFGISIL